MHRSGIFALLLFSAVACSDSGPSGVEDEPTGSPRQQRLEAAQTWMYQIQGLDEDGALDALAATDYPLLVLEPGHNFKDDPDNMDTILSTLRTGPDGSERLLLAYIDIGQAEDYRNYWESTWQAPTAADRGVPDFLLTLDPDGWSGNYVVAYWDTRWKDLWLGAEGIIAELAAAGFDGIYLDWVEAYDEDGVIALAEDSVLDSAEEMLWFIEQLGDAGKAVSEGFLVVAQNAPYLIDADRDWYTRVIDALAVEDTWFHGEGDVAWGEPGSGDLHQRHEGDYSTPNRLAQYDQYLSRDVPVFSVDYCISTKNAAAVYRDARQKGLRPLVTQVALSQLTETPPSDF